ncbi:MAG: GNAT family N-acetyltransferase [Ignavibacteria bacterium]|nr:GNAT family N-acetyltransferase [Ignavibacteria bacterium]
MNIKKLVPGDADDFAKLIKIFCEAFENNVKIPQKEYLSKLLSDPELIVFVSVIDDEIAGGLTIYILQQYYSEKPLAYIYDLAVSEKFRGLGIGGALIEHVCNYCRECGFDEAYVQAEKDDADAVRFYRKTKFTRETETIHFTYSLRRNSG